MSKKILAVAAEPISGELLTSAVGTDDAEVLVVAPALNTKARFWLLLAIQDALATFPADEIVLVTHPEGEENWLEEGVVSDARERFADRPVRHLVVD